MNPGTGEWVDVEWEALRIPVLAGWTRDTTEDFVFKGDGGVVDARWWSDGDLIDNAKLRTITANIGAQAEARLVRVNGRGAIRVVERSSRMTSVMYDVACTPTETADAVDFPFVRIAYVFSGETEQLVGDLFERMEDTTEDWTRRLNSHPLTREGHLEFGPLHIPARWQLILDDGSRHKFDDRVTGSRELGVGCGWIFLIAPMPVDGITEGVIFRPLALRSESVPSALEEFGDWYTRELDAKGAPASLVELSASTARGLGGEVGKYRFVDQHTYGRFVRCGYFFRDILGYWRQVAFTFSTANSDQWMPLLAEVESQSGAARPRVGE